MKKTLIISENCKLNGLNQDENFTVENLEIIILSGKAAELVDGIKDIMFTEGVYVEFNYKNPIDEITIEEVNRVLNVLGRLKSPNKMEVGLSLKIKGNIKKDKLVPLSLSDSFKLNYLNINNTLFNLDFTDVQKMIGSLFIEKIKFKNFKINQNKDSLTLLDLIEETKCESFTMVDLDVEILPEDEDRELKHFLLVKVNPQNTIEIFSARTSEAGEGIEKKTNIKKLKCKGAPFVFLDNIQSIFFCEEHSQNSEIQLFIDGNSFVFFESKISKLVLMDSKLSVWFDYDTGEKSENQDEVDFLNRINFNNFETISFSNFTSDLSLKTEEIKTTISDMKDDNGIKIYFKNCSSQFIHDMLQPSSSVYSLVSFTDCFQLTKDITINLDQAQRLELQIIDSNLNLNFNVENIAKLKLGTFSLEEKLFFFTELSCLKVEPKEDFFVDVVDKLLNSRVGLIEEGCFCGNFLEKYFLKKSWTLKGFSSLKFEKTEIDSGLENIFMQVQVPISFRKTTFKNLLTLPQEEISFDYSSFCNLIYEEESSDFERWILQIKYNWSDFTKKKEKIITHYSFFAGLGEQKRIIEVTYKNLFERNSIIFTFLLLKMIAEQSTFQQILGYFGDIFVPLEVNKEKESSDILSISDKYISDGIISDFKTHFSFIRLAEAKKSYK